MITALALALSMMLAQATPTEATSPGAAPADAGPSQPAPAETRGEPLPPGAPTDSYELAAWCYGALDEYLGIYDRVKPDLRDIDHMFGTSVVEDDPYHSDMAAARVELKMIGDSVTEAEKASPRPISQDGAAAIKQGHSIWSVAESKTSRELARAWMLWALPDRCDSNARELSQRSILFGKALNYNNAPPPQSEPAPQTEPTPQTAPDQSPPPADAVAPAPPAAVPNAQASPTTDTNVPATTATDATGAPAAPAPSPNPPPTNDPAVPPYPTAQPAPQP